MAENWPHTRRLTPWLLAGFLTMLFIVPFQGITFKVHLPADLTPDRLLLIAILGVQIFRVAGSGAKRHRRLGAVEVAVLVFTSVALLSIVLNTGRIFQLGEFTFVEKGFVQLLSYVAFFFIVAFTLRPEELRAFGRLILVLTSITALGTLYESRTGYNVFYVLWGKLLSPIASVIASPTNLHPGDGARAVIVGPTEHGLALASMLTIALPFAVVQVLEERRPGRRFAYLVICGLIVAASLSTSEKTAMVAPVSALVVLMAYRRRLLRWAPLAAIVLIPVIHFASPGALGAVKHLNPLATNGNYTDGRAGDYGAIAPDILSNLVIGRGYGSLNPLDWQHYRILDNQYLDELFNTGILGLLSYLALVLAAIGSAHGVIKRGGTRASPALAAAAGAAAFGTVSATFDAMGYQQAIYSFLFVAGLIALLARDRLEEQSAPMPVVLSIPGDWLRVRVRDAPARSRSRVEQPVLSNKPRGL